MELLTAVAGFSKSAAEIHTDTFDIERERTIAFVALGTRPLTLLEALLLGPALLESISVR
ncbi:MAG: hypothetical protein IT427_00310 [Pirellulales bacterium]|nr:hypothetical protein [Pirellulales bacterium]